MTSQNNWISRTTKVRNMDVKPKTDTKTSDYAPPKPVPNRIEVLTNNNI